MTLASSVRSRANDAAILAGLLWCVAGIDIDTPQADRFALLLVGVALLAVSLTRRLPGGWVGAYAVLIATSDRLVRQPFSGSDVLRATQEAIQTFLGGANPYTHVMTNTDPVGSPFVYPPGEFLFYLPAQVIAGDITRVDTVAGIGILTVVAIVLTGIRVGWERVTLPAMLYASWGISGYRGTDGSNDVSAAFLVVLALALLAFGDERRRSGRIAFILSAIALGWAGAFKQFALLVAPLVIRHLAVAGRDWRRYALVAAVTFAAFVLPFLVWSPGAFLTQQLQALTFHRNIWGTNILSFAAQFGDVRAVVPLFFVAEILVTLVVFALLVRARLPTIGLAALGGTFVVLITLLLARWTTQPYYIYLGAIAAIGLALVDVSARAPEPLDRVSA